MHSSLNCPLKARKQLQAKKRMNPVGRVGKATKQAMREWRAETPTNHEGYHICYLCGRWITPEEMSPEHTKSRARNPGLRTDKSLLKPVCSTCNEDKGSLNDDQYIQKKQARSAGG